MADDGEAGEDTIDEVSTRDCCGVVSGVGTGLNAGGTLVLPGGCEIVSTLVVSAVSTVAFLTLGDRCGNSRLDTEVASLCMSYASP